jgi:serine/threonine protein kinase
MLINKKTRKRGGKITYKARNERTIKTQKRGGKVKTSGGFGCLFIPNLKCKKKIGLLTNNKNQKYVSKLMLKKYAIEEYNLINKFKKKLQKISNYENYFLLNDINICLNVEKLTLNDLKHFDDKCDALNKKDINKKNINNPEILQKLAFLTLPFGGISVSTYLKKLPNSNDLIIFNKSMIKLLNEGIIKMNKMNIHHCDMKSGNILVDNNNRTTKIIDWGLAIDNNLEAFNEYRNRRVLIFNNPLSMIILENNFINKYEDFLNDNQINLDEFLLNYIIDYLKNCKDDTHYYYIQYLIKLIVFKEKNTDDVINNKIIIFIFHYLKKILLKYTKNNKYEVIEFFNNVFLKNVDVYGFITCYIPFLNYLTVEYEKLINEEEVFFYEYLRKILIEYLFVQSDKSIKINKITKDLIKLNNYFFVFDNKTIFKNRNQFSTNQSSTNQSSTNQSSTNPPSTNQSSKNPPSTKE